MCVLLCCVGLVWLASSSPAAAAKKTPDSRRRRSSAVAPEQVRNARIVAFEQLVQLLPIAGRGGIDRRRRVHHLSLLFAAGLLVPRLLAQLELLVVVEEPAQATSWLLGGGA